MEDFFVGVDGGGTTTKLRLEDQHGRCLATAESGVANIRLSMDVAWQSILSAFDLALGSAGLTRDAGEFHVGLGLAGCEIPGISRKFLSYQHPFKRVILKSDGYTACLGAHAGGDGLIVIVGTGAVGWQIEQGESCRVAGWGFPYDDEGSGAWIGMQAVRLMLQWYDSRLAASPMFEAIFNHFNSDLAELLSWATTANSTQFAKLARIVINHLDHDDWAKKLIDQATQHIEIIIATLDKKARQSSLPISLMGGLAQFIKPRLNDQLQTRLVEPKQDADQGAINLVKCYAHETLNH